MKKQFCTGIITLAICLVFLLIACCDADAGEDKALVKRARAMAKSGDIEFAMMYYRQISRDYPNSLFIEEAIFGEGEYAFRIRDYLSAKKSFEEFTARFPKSAKKIFALAYLWKIAQENSDLPKTQALTGEIASFRQISLVFRNSTSFQYLSPLRTKHRALFQIDKIIFHLQGEFFAEINY